jgi:hypothetical protein
VKARWSVARTKCRDEIVDAASAVRCAPFGGKTQGGLVASRKGSATSDHSRNGLSMKTIAIMGAFAQVGTNLLEGDDKKILMN